MNDGYMDAAAVPVPDAGDDTLRAIGAEFVEVLIEHQRMDIGHCRCGWGVDAGNVGQSHAAHTADALVEHTLHHLIERDAARGAAIERVRARCETAGTTQPPFGQPARTLTVAEVLAALDGTEDTDD